MADRIPRLREIGVVRSCFGQRFAIPRQSGLAPSARGRLEIHPDFAIEEAFRGLEAYSHIWIVWIFHANRGREAWRPTVRPPRFRGRRRLGVFATRSPYRPNPLGLSAVRLESIGRAEGRIWLDIGGIDLLDGTPVVDIKPYIPYADRIEQATAGFANEAADQVRVHWLAEALERLSTIEQEADMPLRALVEEVLAQDPRPSRSDPREGFVMRLYDFDLRWNVMENGELVVSSIERRKHDIDGNH